MQKTFKFCRSRQELSNEDLLAKMGVDTAGNEPLKVHLIFQPWDRIFTEPSRAPRTFSARELLALALPLGSLEFSEMALCGFASDFAVARSDRVHRSPLRSTSTRRPSRRQDFSRQSLEKDRLSEVLMSQRVSRHNFCRTRISSILAGRHDSLKK